MNDIYEDNSKFVIGERYFRYLYFDDDLVYPAIETVVFLGGADDLKDKFKTEEGHIYFQDAESFARCGILNERKLPTGEASVYVTCVEKEGSEYDYLSLDGLILALQELRAKRRG